MFSLEHFYFGQLVHHGTPKGDARVLARTRGISDALISTAQELAKVAPHPKESRLGVSVIRGNREIPFLLVHSEKGIAGNVTTHFVILSSEVPRALVGNIGAYQAILPEHLPTFEMLGDAQPIQFVPPPLLSTAQQADVLLDLMTHVRNKTRTIEPLLSAIITGRTLIIENAPPDSQTRLSFAQGLMTLLPPSTRFSVTFALHAETNALPNTQITFVENTPKDSKSTRYDWQTGKVTQETENDYSRFIVSQLRLDAEMAISQAEMLTNTAGWRFKSGENLADALTYASQRSKIDTSILNNLPVEAKEVAQILSDDPTLDDTLRVAYAQHLIKFAIALEDVTYTEPVGVTCSKYPELAKVVYQQFTDAVQNGKASLIFQILAHWLQNPLSPQTPEWVELLQRSALLELRDIVQGRDAESLKYLLSDLQRMESAHTVNRIIPKVIELSIGLASEDAQLPSRILLLGMTYLDRATFQKVLAIPDLVRYLPREIKRFLASLSATEIPNAKGIILEASDQLGEEHRDEALMQFVEMAFNSQKVVLIDAPTLERMTQIAVTHLGGKYLTTILNVARHISDELIEKMPEPTPRYILQLFLASRRYDLLARAMVEQSKNIYGGERQIDYVRALQEMFAKTPLSIGELRKAVETLRELYIKDVPLICVMCGAIEASENAIELDDFAKEATHEMTTNPRYAQVIYHEAPLALIRYHLVHKHHEDVKRLALILPQVASNKDDREGLLAIRESYKALVSEEKHRALAFELLRHYARIAPQRPAQRIVDYYSKELGNPYADKLQRAFEFSLFINSLPLEAYAHAVTLTADLLQNTHEAYFKDRPKVPELDALLENIRVRVDKIRQVKLAEELLRFLKIIFQLAKQAESRALSAETASALAKGTESPRTILEVFRSGGGHLLKGKMLQVKLKQNTHPSPFGNITPPEFYEQLVIANDVLRQPLTMFPNKVTWSAKQIADELESFIGMSYNSDPQAIAIGLGNDWQRLAELIPLMVKDADSSLADENSKLGKLLDKQQQVPKNAVELMRYVYGYFKG